MYLARVDELDLRTDRLGARADASSEKKVHCLGEIGVWDGHRWCALVASLGLFLTRVDKTVVEQDAPQVISQLERLSPHASNLLNKVRVLKENGVSRFRKRLRKFQFTFAISLLE
jgi:hypothetical protein